MRDDETVGSAHLFLNNKTSKSPAPLFLYYIIYYLIKEISHPLFELLQLFGFPLIWGFSYGHPACIDIC